MKKVLILLSIMTTLSLSCCMGGGTPAVESDQIDSASTHTETENDTTIKISNEMDIKDLKTILNKNIEEDMIDISSFFSTDEIESIRKNFIRQLRFYDRYSILSASYTSDEEEWKNLVQIPKEIEITDELRAENSDVLYRIFTKKTPTFRPVPEDTFIERMKEVFDIDVKSKEWARKTFYTNHSMEEESYYSTFIDFNNHFITLESLPFVFKKDIDWDAYKIEGEDDDEISVKCYKAIVKMYETYYDKASQEKFEMLCSTSDFNFLFHINNYVFHGSKASLSWLLSNQEGVYFLRTLYKFFNYDKEPRINNLILKQFYSNVDVSKGFPLKTPEYTSLFGEVESCAQTQYFNYFKFKVRTGMMQYVVDNCYDETDLDTFGIRKDKLICIMEDCFDYLFEYVLQGDKYKESNEVPNYQVEYHTYQGCHYYQVCAYLAYYLTKAHEKFVSYGHGDPRCWHNALVNNLREDLKNNDARFENYVKENNYFNLEGFEQIMKDAHEQAMIEQ